jgi:urease accessory protein
LEARFELRAGETRMTHLACRPPLQALRALRDGTTAELVVATLGPGLMGGDSTELVVRVGECARARATSAAATRVLPMRGGRGSTACVELTVDAGGWLEYLPLPTILQRDAAYRQRTRISLADGAAALVGEVLVPGRLASGEVFAFAELDLALGVRASIGGELLVAERQLLRPADGDPRATGALPEPDVVLASLFILAPGRSLDALGDEIAARLAGAGVTALPNDAGLLIRAAVPSAQCAERILAEAAIAARGSLLSA